MGWFSDLKKKIKKASSKGYNNYKKSQSKKSKKAVKSSYGELVKSTQKKSTAKSSSKSSSSKSKMAAQAAVKVAAEKKAQREATERKRKKDQALKAAQATKSASENLTKMREKQKKNSLTKLSQGVTAVSAYKKANENVYKPMKNIETARKIEREKAEKREAERNKGTTKLSQGGTVTNIYKRANKSVHEPVKNIEAVNEPIRKRQEERKERRIEDVKKAIDKAKNTDALGLNINSKKYEETHSYKTNNNLEKNAAKFKLILDYKNQLQEQLKKSEYSHLSEKQKKEIISKMLNEGRGDIDKIINEAYPDKVKYRNMTMNEHLKFQNATRTAGGDAKLASKMLDDKLKNNLAKLYSSNYKRGKIGTGFVEGFSPIDVQNYTRNLTRDKDGNSRLDERTIRQAENSLGYKAANMAGFLAGSLTTGVGGAPEKALGESIAKSLLKSTTKDSVKKAAIKRFAAERMADVTLSSSYDAIDSLKGAVDENGNIDWKQAAKNMGVNAAGNVILGGALDLGVKGAGKGINKLKSNAIGKGTDINKLTKEEFNQTIKLIAKEKAGKKLSVSEKNVLNSNLAKAKKGAIKNTEEKAVADVRAKAYNKNGGKIDENRQMGKADISTNTGRTADIRQVESTIQGRQRSVGIDRSGAVRPNGKTELGGMRGNFEPVSLKGEIRNKMNASGIVDTKLKGSDYATFSKALDDSKGRNPYGGYVDSKSVDELIKSNAKTFLSDDGSVGITVKSDGDIVGAFNSGKKYKGAVTDMLITARANGGIKMDCYGKKLVNEYERVGYVPVARVPFNAEYIDNDLLLKNKPDVYVMMKNTDDLDTVIDNVAIGGYKKSSQTELDSLPTFKDYDEALNYRDDLLYKQEQNTSDVAAHKQESKTGNDENFLTPEQKARLDEKLKEANGGKTSDEYIAENKNKIENKIIKEENPTSETFQEKAYTKAGREKEVKEQFIQTHKKTYEANSKEIQKVFDDVSEKYHKIRGITKKEAIQKSSEELKSKGINQMYDDYMDTKVADMVGEEMLFASRSKTLFDELAKYPDDVEMMRKLQNVEEFFCHWASSQGRGLNAVKLFLNSTPAGKLRILEKDLAFINKYFGDRLKEPIKFTDEQIAMIQRTKDMTEDEVRSVINTLNTQIWEQIPATLFERLNEFRRFSMLANPKTHIRNLAGNSVFALGRTVSDYIEVKMMKSGAVKKAVAKRNPDAKIRMVDVSNVERKEAKDFIYNEFDKRYENMDSAVKWRDDDSG
jgi:hypothetical protein|uniref:Uncharacterized protein n=1 Tax=virus sp. ctyMK1 TaxID=2828002 RepID=A0A8S5REE3_9VIRU|nr:MAG TPA: hypothetical protein [virus sp. ctyMK1]